MEWLGKIWRDTHKIDTTWTPQRRSTGSCRPAENFPPPKSFYTRSQMFLFYTRFPNEKALRKSLLRKAL